MLRKKEKAISPTSVLLIHSPISLDSSWFPSRVLLLFFIHVSSPFTGSVKICIGTLDKGTPISKTECYFLLFIKENTHSLTWSPSKVSGSQNKENNIFSFSYLILVYFLKIVFFGQTCIYCK